MAELLRTGHDAIDAYDYDLARDCLTRAFDDTAGSAEAALPVLSLLVDHLAADQ